MQTIYYRHSCPRRACELALSAIVTALTIAPASAQTAPAGVPILSKPARQVAAEPTGGQVLTGERSDTQAKSPAVAKSTHYWYDGDRKRLLTIDDSSIADFGSAQEPKATPELTTATVLAAKTGSDRQLSPILRSADSGQMAGALPGGVLVRMTRAINADAAQAMASAFGARIRHPIGTSTAAGFQLWLFESPAGLASLELANRIHESGQVRSAAPNWWKPRTLK